MRNFSLLLLILLNLQSSFAASCLENILKIQRSQEFEFLTQIRGATSILAPEIRSMMSDARTSENFYVQFLHLKNNFRTMLDAFTGTDDALKLSSSNDMVRSISVILNTLNVEHAIVEDFDSLAIKFARTGNNRLAGLLRRMQREATADIYYNPYLLYTNNFAGYYLPRENRLYITSDSILRYRNGDVIGLFKPTGGDFHEFLHARFNQRRAQGIEHALDTVLFPKSGYRALMGYEEMMAQEELAVYINQLNEYAIRIHRYEVDYRIVDWMEHRHELAAINGPAGQYANVIIPMAQNIRDYATRLKTGIEGQLQLSRPNTSTLYFQSQSGAGRFSIQEDGTVLLKYKSANEDSDTIFYNPELATYMQAETDGTRLAMRLLEALLDKTDKQIEYANRAIYLANRFKRYQRALDRAIVSGDRERIRAEFQKIRTLITSSRNLFL